MMEGMAPISAFTTTLKKKITTIMMIIMNWNGMDEYNVLQWKHHAKL